MANDPLRLASSAAYYALFAIPSAILILLFLFGMFINEQQLGNELYQSIVEILDEESAEQIFKILTNLADFSDEWWMLIGSAIIFLIASTTFFVVLKSSINQLWNIKTKSERKALMIFRRRAISVAIIIFGGILFLIALLADALLAVVSNFIPDIIPGVDWFLAQVISNSISILIITIWFAAIFKYLPDVIISWKALFTGAFATAVLFTAGKIVMGNILFSGELTTIYGAASSIIALLIFIYYSAYIIFFGASFTRAFAEYKGFPIRPGRYAFRYRIIKDDKENQ
jgi:membrane protein